MNAKVAVRYDADVQAERANQRNALISGYLGWTLDAFDFFLLTFVLAQVATEFGRSVPDIALTLTASLVARPLGAVVFGLLADRYGRRLPMMICILYYSLTQLLSGLAPNYATFFALRFLFGVGMGGEWGVGASLVLETLPAKWRGLVSGFLQMGYTCGYLLAAVVYYLVFPTFGWRALFFVGALPALLTLFIRTKVKETEAWREARTDWTTYRRAVVVNWRIFLFMTLLMTMMAFVSHGTQDLYPMFLQKERHFSPGGTATITVISMIGAICGGLIGGFLSDRWGRRRTMIAALMGGALMIPAWVFAPTTALLVTGAFFMQFMVQASWGVVPAHINELSPGQLRGFFPGFAYQLGIFSASSIAYIEAVLGERFTYSQAMGILALGAFVAASVVIALGPEAKGVSFRKADTASASPDQSQSPARWTHAAGSVPDGALESPDPGAK